MQTKYIFYLTNQEYNRRNPEIYFQMWHYYTPVTVLYVFWDAESEFEVFPLIPVLYGQKSQKTSRISDFFQFFAYTYLLNYEFFRDDYAIPNQNRQDFLQNIPFLVKQTRFWKTVFKICSGKKLDSNIYMFGSAKWQILKIKLIYLISTTIG